MEISNHPANPDLTEVCLQRSSRSGVVWGQGNPVLQELVGAGLSFGWKDAALLVSLVNRPWDTFLCRQVLQVENADGVVLGKIVFYGMRRMRVSLPGMECEVSLMRFPFSFRDEVFVGRACYRLNLPDSLSCLNNEGVTVRDLLLGVVMLYCCGGNSEDRDGGGDGGGGDGD